MSRSFYATTPSAGVKNNTLADVVDPEDQAIGRSRGELSPTIHAPCDALGNLTGLFWSGGQANGLDGADVLLDDC